MEQTHDKQMFIPGEWVTLAMGRYRLVGERCLGEGGQSAVWKAESEADGKTVVVRTVNLFDISNDRRDIRTDEEIHDLLRYAAEEIAFLKKMGQAQAAENFILPVLDDGFITHPLFPSLQLPTTVMPWYECGDLGQFVRSRRQHGTFTAVELLRWARQLATALVYIHQQHSEQVISVHRDIKPKNVVLDARHDIGLTDFGIVRAAASLGTSSVVGSFTNCAPEQVLATHRSANRHKQYLITPAVDIYSLAITLHELMAGQTEAQKKLTLKTKDTNTLDEHDSYLPPSGTVQAGKIGKLGEIGGLTAKEQRHLRTQVLDLLRPPTQNQTIVLGKGKRELPDADFIADGMVDVLARMLAPWPADRPTAADVLATFTALEQSLSPVLEGFGVSLRQDRLTVGQTCTLRLVIKGSGLPTDLRWLRFECNGQPLSIELPPIPNPSPARGEGSREVRVDVPLPPETGEYRLKVSAMVAGKVHSQQVVCHVTLTAEQWWGLGKHEAALRLELRPAWLATLQQQANTRPKLNALHALLTGLVLHYSMDAAAQAQLAEALRQVDEPPPPLPPTPEPQPKRRWLAVLAIPVIVTGIVTGALYVSSLNSYRFPPVGASPAGDSSVIKYNRDKSQRLLGAGESLAGQAPTAEVEPSAVAPFTSPSLVGASPAGDSSPQQIPKAAAPAEQAAPAGPPAAAPTVPELTPAEQRQQAETWLQGSDKTQWAPAVKQLEALAESGDADASYTLGGLHYAGIKGLKYSTKTGCAWYKKAANSGHKDAKATGKDLGCPGF